MNHDSFISNITEEGDMFRIEITQFLPDKHFVINASLLVHRSTMNRFLAMKSAQNPTDIVGTSIDCTLVDAKTFTVNFPISGFFLTIPRGLEYPIKAHIGNVLQERANGVATLSIFADAAECQSDMGDYFYEEYVLSSEELQNLQNVYVLEDPNFLKEQPITIDASGICYSSCELHAKSIEISAQFH